MIELSANNHLVSEQGREASLDVDGVRREVRDCCLAVGVQETWLAEQMELALDDFFLSREDRGETGVPARGEIDALVARLLMSAGYRDVAAEYSRRRQIRILPVADATLWDAARIRRLVGQLCALPESAIVRLTARIGAQIEKLGFREVSDGLITELAAHLAAGAMAENGPALPGLLPSDSPWLLPADFWKKTEADITGSARRLCADGVLQPRAVSRLLPVPGIVLDLGRMTELATQAGASPESLFWPELDRITLAAREILEIMDALLLETAPDVSGGVPRVVVAGFPALAAAWKPALRKHERQQLMHDTAARIRQTLARAGTPAVLVHFPHHGA